uniref:Uncharacterized protein n=2 Tax=Escherichia coli TaxID=562 RepID=A0A343J1B0_ECOLX|nr:hypothetical protein ECSA44_05900 [Escherichia coli]
MVSQDNLVTLTHQPQVFLEETAQQTLFALLSLMERQQVDNLPGWMLTMIKKPMREFSRRNYSIRESLARTTNILRVPMSNCDKIPDD